MATVSSISSTQPWTLTFGTPAQVNTLTGEVSITPDNFAGAGVPGIFSSLVVAGTEGGPAEVQFKVGDVVRGSVGLNVDGDLTLRLYDEGGVPQATVAFLASGLTSGDVQFPGGISATGRVSAGGGLVAEGDVDFALADQVSLPADSPLNTYTLQANIKTIVSASAAVAYVPIPYNGAGDIMQIDVVADAAIATGALTVTPAVGAVPIAGSVISMSALTAAGTIATGLPDPPAEVANGDVLSFTVGGGNTTAGTATIVVTIRRAAP